MFITETHRLIYLYWLGDHWSRGGRWTWELTYVDRHNTTTLEWYGCPSRRGQVMVRSTLCVVSLLGERLVVVGNERSWTFEQLYDGPTDSCASVGSHSGPTNTHDGTGDQRLISFIVSADSQAERVFEMRAMTVHMLGWPRQ